MEVWSGWLLRHDGPGCAVLSEMEAEMLTVPRSSASGWREVYMDGYITKHAGCRSQRVQSIIKQQETRSRRIHSPPRPLHERCTHIFPPLGLHLIATALESILRHVRPIPRPPHGLSEHRPHRASPESRHQEHRHGETDGGKSHRTGTRGAGKVHDGEGYGRVFEARV